MQQLITRITDQTGLSEDQVQEVIAAVADYVKEKYPLLASTVDLVLEQKGKAAAGFN